MTDIQQPSIPPAPNTLNASQPGSAGSPSASASSSNTPSAPATQPPRSYAHATRHSVSTPLVSSAASSVASGSGAQHGRQQSVNPRGDNASMAGPAIVNSSPAANGTPSASEHSRKPSVTIGPQGASGNMPNGGPAASTTRHNINFGQMNANAPSPAAALSTPSHQQHASLSAPPRDPRVTSPASSPSPIPPPTRSGGQLPSGLQGSSNGLSFGSMPEHDANRSVSGGPPGAALMPGQMPTHYRRASSHSHHGDMQHANMGMGPGRGGYAGAGRGRGGYPQGYPPMPYSPAQQNFRPVPGQSRPPSLPHQFQNQVGMGPGSPHMPPRSPAPMGSQPGTPHMQHMSMSHQQPGAYPPPNYGQFQGQLGPQSGQFAMQPEYNAQYGYFSQPYQMPPNYYPQGPPQSPGRPFKQGGPQGAPGPYMSGHQHSQSQIMSRTSSQVSERPASSLGGSSHPPQQPSGTASNHGSSHAPSQSQSNAPLSSNFTIPSKQRKGLVIKNADGEVVTFDKKSSPAPAVVPSPSPAPSSSAATPPPRSASTASHTRSDSKTAKSAAEIKAEFQEQVKKGQEKDQQKIKEEGEPTVVTAPPVESKEPEPAQTRTELPETPIEPVVAETKEPEEKVSSEDVKADATAAKEPDVAPAALSEANKGESEEERKKREDDEEMERMIAEMEAADKEEEQREARFQEKKKKEAAEKATKDKEEAARADEKMKQAERDAEAAEEAREKEKESEEKGDDETDAAKAEREEMFASLKRPTLGPGADGESGAATPQSEEPAPSSQPTTPAPGPSPVPSQKPPTSAKPKPAALKLETAKSVEPAQPTPGMRALRSARMLQLQNESVNYPEGIQSPNPALNQSGKRGGRMYDKSFLMQFQEAFKEKPSLDWDQKLKETVGDPTDSAAPKSARTPASSRSVSHRGPAQEFSKMGAFQSGSQNRTLPQGTTSAERFAASSGAGRQAPGNQAFGFGRGGAGFPMGAPMMGRQPSVPGMPSHGPAGSRSGQQRIPSKGDSRRGGAGKSKQEQFQEDKKMPLTAKGDVKTLEKSATGWVASSLSRVQQPTVDLSGMMAPDMVQRKVKAALNKMTPERFEKIADQIMEIAAQSRRETDGRTLRQVIALTFEKATDEAHWASMYAKFCKRMLEDMNPEIQDSNVTDKNNQPLVGGPLFRKYLLNRCQEEFERGWTVNLPGRKEGQTEEAAMMSDEYYTAAAAKRRGLGLVQFIGELYKLQMLSIRIMHECFHRLLDFEDAPDEASIESLVKLLRTVGGQMSREQQGPNLLGSYFERIEKIVKRPGLPSRMYFMLLDVIDLRKNNWVSKDDAKGPKTITEIRQEALEQQQRDEAERAKQNTRGPRQSMGRDSRNFSGGAMGPPPDYNRNTVGTDDLRRLQGRGGSSRQPSQTPGRSLGPTSMLSSRSGSGRMGLGPQGGLLARGGDSSGGSSGMHSRSASMQADNKKDEESKANTNAFSALAAMDTEGSKKTPTNSPPTTKAQLASLDAAAGDSKADSTSASDNKAE